MHIPRHLGECYLLPCLTGQKGKEPFARNIERGSQDSKCPVGMTRDASGNTSRGVQRQHRLLSASSDLSLDLHLHAAVCGTHPNCGEGRICLSQSNDATPLPLLIFSELSSSKLIRIHDCGVYGDFFKNKHAVTLPNGM